MRVLFIHNNYANNNSGEEHSVEGLARVLIENGHEVEWYRRSSDVIKNSVFKKIIAFFSGFYNPKAIKELKVKLELFKPDVIQIQNLYPFISPGIIRTIKKAGIPIVMRCPNYRIFCPTGLHLEPNGNICEKCLSPGREIHCVTKNCEKNHFKSIGYAARNFLARKVWGINRKMDAYIVQTNFQKKKFIKNGIPANKIFIVSGLAPKIHKIQKESDPIFVSFIGRISDEKGITEFLNAAQNLPNIPFMVIGDFQKKIKLKANSPSNVIWKGYVVGKELDMLFEESRIVVVPSKWYEGFPNVLTRAMIHSNAIITSNLGAMADIIDHCENGILVEPGNSEKLTKAIKELYWDSERCNLYGRNARKKAISSFTSVNVYNSLFNVYLGILEKKKREKSIVKKNILMILHFPPPVHGAAMVGQYIRDSKLINSTFNCKYINLGTSISVEEIGKGGWIKLLRYFKIVKCAIFALYGFKPDLVYITLTATGIGFYKDVLLVIISKIFGKKVVIHFHNKGVSTRQERIWDNLLYKIVFKDTSVILLSKSLYYDIKKYVPEERVIYCANGIPEIKFNNGQRRINLDNDRVQILFLSNLIKSKGVYILLEACKILKLKRLPFKCIYVGGEADISAEEFRKKIKVLGLNDFVSYAGRKFGKEKEEIYVKADIFVFPTYYSNETFGLVNLEAMQFSLPVVSTFEGGIPDVIEDGITGFLVNQNDVNALAEKIEILIKDSELRMQLGKNGRKRYEKLFTIEVFEKRFANIIKELT